MTNDFLLGDDWLIECITRLESQGASEEQLFAFARAWELAVMKYSLWLETEGFSSAQMITIIKHAITAADFDLSKFPKC
jgi:hypothetical protein